VPKAAAAERMGEMQLDADWLQPQSIRFHLRLGFQVTHWKHAIHMVHRPEALRPHHQAQGADARRLLAHSGSAERLLLAATRDGDLAAPSLAAGRALARSAFAPRRADDDGGLSVQVDQGYLRAETISVANGLLIDAQTKVDIVGAWGGGLVASADGVRFTVPVQTVHAGYSPRCFGLRKKGATWLNVVNDQVMGIGGIVVPGTLRDSLFIFDARLGRDGGPKPETVITDTAFRVPLVVGQLQVPDSRGAS
jgi:hypothetical protein